MNRVSAPLRAVVIITRVLDTTKCTRQWPGCSSGVFLVGLRSLRYCSTASSALCVWSVLSSSVATGNPLTVSTRSIVEFLVGSKRTCRSTRSRFFSYHSRDEVSSGFSGGNSHSAPNFPDSAPVTFGM